MLSQELQPEPCPPSPRKAGLSGGTHPNAASSQEASSLPADGSSHPNLLPSFHLGLGCYDEITGPSSQKHTHKCTHQRNQTWNPEVTGEEVRLLRGGVPLPQQHRRRRLGQWPLQTAQCSGQDLPQQPSHTPWAWLTVEPARLSWRHGPLPETSLRTRLCAGCTLCRLGYQPLLQPELNLRKTPETQLYPASLLTQGPRVKLKACYMPTALQKLKDT